MREMLEFLWKNKNWWLIPPILVFFIFGVLIVISQVSPIGAFVYMLF